MCANEEWFAELASQVETQLAETVGIRLLSPTVGAFDASTGTETGPVEAESSLIAVVRERDRVEDVAGGAGGYTRTRAVDYLVRKATAATAGWTPAENQIIVQKASDGGDGVRRRVVKVTEEVHQTMWRVVTWALA